MLCWTLEHEFNMQVYDEIQGRQTQSSIFDQFSLIFDFSMSDNPCMSFGFFQCVLTYNEKHHLANPIEDSFINLHLQ